MELSQTVIQNAKILIQVRQHQIENGISFTASDDDIESAMRIINASDIQDKINILSDIQRNLRESKSSEFKGVGFIFPYFSISLRTYLASHESNEIYADWFKNSVDTLNQCIEQEKEILINKFNELIK